MPKTTEVFSRSFLACSLFWSILCGLFVITGTTTESVATGGTAKAAGTTVSARRGGERHMKLLYDYLFLDYQREIRPVYNDSKPITVTVQFWLKQILKVNERDQTLNIYCWLELYWKDELLTWDPAEFGGLDRIHVPSTKIWKPDILVYNNANMNVEDNELETNAIIKSNGEVTLFRAMITDIACTLSLSLFPFDQQVCYLIFASWSMDGSKLLLYPMNDTDNLELYIRNTEWDLTDFAVKSYEKIYDCCPYAFPDITYFVVLKRSPSYYIFSLIIPSAFITIVTIVGFFTPHSTTGENTEKVSLGVTACMSTSIIMMMVSDEVPATSEDIPLIGKYYIGLFFLIFIAAFTTTLTLAYQMRGNAGTRMSPRMKYILFEKIAKNPLFSWLFAVQIAHKRNLGRSRNYDNHNQNNASTYVFENNCTAVKTDGIALLSAGNGNTCKVRVNNKAENEKKAKIVQMEELTGDLKKNSVNFGTGCEDKNCAEFVFSRLYACIQTIEESIVHTHEQRNTEFEWQQGTRIIERIIMIIYILLTVAFALYMIGGGGEDIKLTDEVMDRVKR